MPLRTPASAADSTGPSFVRRWRRPPPFLREGPGLAGAEILDEIPASLGLVLWQTARDVELWSEIPADKRDDLFGAAAERRRLAQILSLDHSAAAVDAPLRAVASMLAHPADTAPEAVMLACQRISQWAEAQDAMATALAFAQAAALAAPGSAREALRVGRLARRRGQHARAEGWLQRAIVLARQQRDRGTHAFAYTSLGNLHFIRGNVPAAERYQRRALGIARRYSLHLRAAAALHDLFVVCAESGRDAEAIQLAREALQAYGPRHARVAALAHDVAYYWMRRGEFARALPVLRASASRTAPHQRIVAIANVARAAGAVGDRETFDEYRRTALAIVDRDERAEHSSAALLDLARGTAALGDYDDAEALARRALHLATTLGEHRIRFEAESEIQAIRAERAARPTSTSVEADPQADALSEDLTDALTADSFAAR